jgi:Raf kinase inhibitor-like YbhB/YbcL family protein
MKTRSLRLALASALLLGTALVPGAQAQNALTLSSTDVAEGAMMADQFILNGFGCMGGNVSPQLSWSGAPAGTQSFALTMYDPDAPTGSGWWHWLVVDIPANSTGLPQGWGQSGTSQLQGGRQTRTDFGAPGYGGPCPPPGTPHHYVFTLYALDIGAMEVPDDASGALVGFNIGAHTLASASITALYGR